MLDINTVTNEKYSLGGVNFYEDPHFSYFYLSESLNANTNEIYPGYSEIIAMYSNGIEKYFIQKEEAKTTATWLLNKILSTPKWFVNILNQIEEKSKRLNSFVVDPDCKYSTSELLQLYELHFQLNTDLYKVARIPEALDRGEPYFTNYLKGYLIEKGYNPHEIPSLFDFLTISDKLSIFGVEQQELNLIRQEIFSQYPNIKTHYAALMLLDPKFRKKIHDHSNKWSVLNYHGYRNPKLLSESDFLSRILLDPITDPNHDSTTNWDISAIDEKHKMLFGLYSEIGRVKILRRFYQLTNFYNLDNLIFRIAEKLNLSELQIRYCLPTEIKSLLSAKSLTNFPVNKPNDKCLIYYKDNTQTFLSKKEMNQIEEQMRSPIQFSEDRTYKGHCVSLGKVQGRARKVDSLYSDLNRFTKGDILLFQSIDPDFLPFLKKAAGVVTEQGGVTSHASIICRELKIPTISGIANVLELINENDLVEVDAYNETVKVISKDLSFANEILVKAEDKTNPEIVGTKATNLFLASQKEISVPHFHLLSYNAILKLYQSDQEKLRTLMQNVCDNLKGSPESKFILRSSCTFEDSPKHFYAGYFKSFILNKDEPIKAIKNFIDYNTDKGYVGSIILQSFVDAEYCGVCMLGDINFKDTKHLVVEYSKGSINHATAGDIDTNRSVYNMLSEEFVTDEIVVENANNIQSDIVNWFKKIETKFPNPTYLEWGFKSGEFWLYQLRFKIKSK